MRSGCGGCRCVLVCCLVLSADSCCLSVPLRSRRREQSPEPLARTKSAALSASDSHPVPFTLPSDDPFPEHPPTVPRHGTASAPLENLLSWRTEIHDATLEYRAAAAARQTAAAALDAAFVQEQNANSRFATAFQRRRAAWKCYLSLVGIAYTDSRSLSASGGTSAGGSKGKADVASSDVDGVDDGDDDDVLRYLEGDGDCSERDMDTS